MSMDEEIATKLKQLHGSDDPEMAHGIADDLIIELLSSLGYTKTVDAYKGVPKWYA